MYLRKENGRFWKWTGIFFALMVVFTLLSRAAYQQGTAVVVTAAPANGVIAHSIQVTGKTIQNQELAVTTLAGLRIAGIPVNEGQQVKQGDILFSLDMDYLAQTILYQEQEMRKQELSIQAAWSQSNATQQQRSNAQAQAEENYNAAVSQGQTALDRAQRDLDRAKEALENFRNGVGAEAAREEALLAECQSAKEAYEAAVLARDTWVPTEEQPEMPPELDGAVQEAFAAIEAADAALEAFRQEQSNAPALSEQELLSAVEAAQEAYDDALTSLEQDKTTYGRAIQSASLPTGTSHAAQIGQITYEQMSAELEKLKALEAADGNILSPVDGVVTARNIQTGEKTTDSTAILLADLGQGYQFSGLVTQEQSQYIGVGDTVTIRSGSSGKLYKDLAVTTFAATEDAGGGYRITVQLPAGSFSLGASAELLFTRKSQPYACCVPLSALRLDERNQPFVLVTQEVDTVLGKQVQAKKISVTVLDKNETTAALAEGAVNGQHQVIVAGDKEVAHGSRVRVD